MNLYEAFYSLTPEMGWWYIGHGHRWYGPFSTKAKANGDAKLQRELDGTYCTLERVGPGQFTLVP